MADEPSTLDEPDPVPKLTLGFLDVDTPDDFFEPMTEEELAEWE